MLDSLTKKERVEYAACKRAGAQCGAAMTHEQWTEEIIALHEAGKKLHARIERLEAALQKVDALITTFGVQLDRPPVYRFMTTGQNEAAHAVRAALAPQEEPDGH